MRTITVTLLSMLFASTASAQRFSTNKVYFTAKDRKTSAVTVHPATSFAIKKQEGYSWAKFKKGKGKVTFSVAENTTGYERTCRFVLLDVDGYPVDTLKLIQKGRSLGSKSNESSDWSGTRSTQSRTTSTRRGTTSSSRRFSDR